MPQRVLSLETIRAGNRDRQRRCRERRQAAKAEAAETEAANTSTDMLINSAANARSLTSATTTVSITGYKSPVSAPSTRRTIPNPTIAVNDTSLGIKTPRQAVSLETIRAGNRDRQRRCRERRQAAKAEAANTSTDMLISSAASATSVTSGTTAVSISGYKSPILAPNSRQTFPTPTVAVDDTSLIYKMLRQAVSLQRTRAGNRDRQRRFRERRKAAKEEAANTSTDMLSDSAANAMPVISTAAISMTGHELALLPTDTISVTATP